MAKGRAVAIVLEAGEKSELTALTRRHGAPQALAERARIVLAAAAGLNNKEIAGKVGVCAATAGTWRNRFAESRTVSTTSRALVRRARSATMRSPPQSARRWKRVRKARRIGA